MPLCGGHSGKSRALRTPRLPQWRRGGDPHVLKEGN